MNTFEKAMCLPACLPSCAVGTLLLANSYAIQHQALKARLNRILETGDHQLNQN